MNLFNIDNTELEIFVNKAEDMISTIEPYSNEKDVSGLKKVVDNLKIKVDDFYRENRKLNIGVVGQVKAGKSSFLNTLLFKGEEILPKASTPKTATLTKMEYSEENIIQIEYYSKEDWEVLVENSLVDLEDEIYTSAREIVEMVKNNGVDPYPYLEKGLDRVKFDTYEELISNLNEYVGEDGKFTPIVKAVTLYMNKEEFKGISIVDTPGLNDPIASRTIRTKEFMEVCDVVFFLSQSGSFLDKSDWTLLSSQLPQKGVKKLVLIASKYDSGIRDVLRKKDEDDIFGDDDNTADNITKACKIINRKLKKRARQKVEEFVKDLEMRGSTEELIDVIKQCASPIMVSSLAYNMLGKDIEEYTSEESNIYNALKLFSDDISSDLRILGNFDEVHRIFKEVVKEKEAIFVAKAKGFIPNAKEELKNILSLYLEKTNKRIQILEDNDKEKILENKNTIESQINRIRAEISALFGEYVVKIDSERNSCIRELRDISKQYTNINDRTGTKIIKDSYRVSDSKWWNPFSWGRSHIEYYTYEEKYSYCIAADAIDNLKKFGLETSNQIEEVFENIINLKEMKRRLLKIVVNNFDMGSEKYDSSLFRITVEETVNSIQFPIFDIDISNEMNSIAGQFTGELTSAKEKNALITALTNAISRIYDRICADMDREANRFKNDITTISKKVEDTLLNNIINDLDELIKKFDDKEKEISGYKEYVRVIEKEFSTLED